MAFPRIFAISGGKYSEMVDEGVDGVGGDWTDVVDRDILYRGRSLCRFWFTLACNNWPTGHGRHIHTHNTYVYESGDN